MYGDVSEPRQGERAELVRQLLVRFGGPFVPVQETQGQERTVVLPLMSTISCVRMQEGGARMRYGSH